MRTPHPIKDTLTITGVIDNDQGTTINVRVTTVIHSYFFNTILDPSHILKRGEDFLKRSSLDY